MSQPRNIFHYILELNKLLEAMKWLLPTSEGRRRRQLRRERRRRVRAAKKAYRREEITWEEYSSILNEGLGESPTHDEGVMNDESLNK